MAVEKNVSWGRKLGAPLGAVLLGWGLALVAVAVLAAQHTHLH
jgi:predicted metal-binding membrane protein